MKCFVFVSIQLMFFSSVFSQDEERTFNVGIGSGVNFIQNRDGFMSPLVYRGVSFPIHLNFQYASAKFEHHLEVDGASSVITNAYQMKNFEGTILNEWHQFFLDYRFLCKFSQEQSTVQHAVGGQFDPMFFYRSYPFLGAESWEFMGGIGPAYAVNYKMGKKHQFIGNFSIPLISFIHRPEHTFDEAFFIDLYEGGSLLKYGFFALNGFGNFRFQTDVRYNFQFHPHWRLTASAQLRYIEIKEPLISKTVFWSGLIHLNYSF